MCTIKQTNNLMHASNPVSERSRAVENQFFLAVNLSHTPAPTSANHGCVAMTSLKLKVQRLVVLLPNKTKWHNGSYSCTDQNYSSLKVRQYLLLDAV